MKKLFLIVLLLFMPLPVLAGTFYISPGGSGTTCDIKAPCALSRIAVAGVAQPGDIWLLRNGTYGAGPNLDCTSGINNGTAGNYITVKAENERQAFLDTSGGRGITFTGCSYWWIEGLHIRQGDNAGQSFDVIGIYNSSHHIVVRRNLIRETNRYLNTGNSAIITWNSAGGADIHDILIEENEIRSCFANCVNLKNIANSEMRRNYCNNSSNWDAGLNNPAACFTLYPGTTTIMENNICESVDACLDVENHADSTGNKFLGNIAFNVLRNVISDRTPELYTSSSVLIENNLLVAAQQNTYHAWAMLNVNGLTVRNNTVIAAGTNAYSGILIGGTLTPANVAVTNTRVTGFSNGYGIYISSGGTISYSNASSNGTNFSPAATNSTTTAPTNLHSCYLWVPPDSSMHGAGVGGADVGATILYAYEGSSLTSNKLWNTTTGAPTFSGAIVAGVNDQGATLYNIGTRLNINQGGCSFPASYAAVSPVVAISLPTGCAGTSAACTTSSSSFTLTGSVSGTPGSIAWACIDVPTPRCGSGGASWTPGTWTTIAAITFKPGKNVVTVTATDNLGAIGAASITITYAPTFPGNTLAGSWAFNEGSGTSAADSSGNGNTATLNNGPTWVAGKYDTGVQMDGVNDNVTVGDANSLRFTRSFTVAAWVNLRAVHTDFRTIAVKNGIGGASYSWALYASIDNAAYGDCVAGASMIWINTNGTSGPSYYICGPALAIGVPVHIAASYSFSTLALYIDGVPIQAIAATGYMESATGTLEFAGSQYNEYLDAYWLDEPHIYNFALPLGNASNTVPNAACTAQNRADQNGIDWTKWSIIGAMNCQIIAPTPPLPVHFPADATGLKAGALSTFKMGAQ